MAFAQPYSGTLTISTTEQSLISGNSTLQSNTTAGVYELWLDLSALAAGDGVQLKLKEKVISGGTQNIAEGPVYSGPQSPPIVIYVSSILMNGWDITLTQTGGVARAIPYSIRQVA